MARFDLEYVTLPEHPDRARAKKFVLAKVQKEWRKLGFAI